MGSDEKVLAKILRGTSDANVPFRDVCHALQKLGFAQRIRGDHHIFTRDNVEEILNLQPKGSKAKPYQVKQVRGVNTTLQANTGVSQCSPSMRS
ncbi:MAG: type II toxin-antitoxin system HicA family toxin [Chloroflexi bacterium]|nr:type II toxin-antitoxin system HicA family toxin [Chloroflexota bacterium]